MNIYVFEDLQNVSGNYHPGGGAVIVALDIESAKIFAGDTEYLEISDEDWENVTIYELAEYYEAKVYIFPDAGCC